MENSRCQGLEVGTSGCQRSTEEAGCLGHGVHGREGDEALGRAYTGLARAPRQESVRTAHFRGHGLVESGGASVPLPWWLLEATGKKASTWGGGGGGWVQPLGSAAPASTQPPPRGPAVQLPEERLSGPSHGGLIPVNKMCGCVGVRVCRCAGVQEYECAGVRSVSAWVCGLQECECAAVQECRSVSVRVCSVQECRNVGVQVCRSMSVQVCGV